MKDTLNPTDPPNLVILQDASLQLLNLLRAADYLRDTGACPHSGPLFAVLEASLTQAKFLDDVVNDLIDGETAELVKQ